MLVIKCWKVPGCQKADIRIKINGITKNISIKKGIKNEVHIETIDNFIKFLAGLKVDKYCLNEIKKYLYADGTNDGKGNFRQSIKEYKQDNQKVIDFINNVLSNDYILTNIAKRSIIKGRISELEVDAIIYGVTNDFLWIAKEEINKILLLKANDYSTALHFGPLTLQPWDRNLKRNPKYEYRRDYIQLKWYNICDDIIETMAFIRNMY